MFLLLLFFFFFFANLTGIIPFSGPGVFPANLVSTENLCTTERRGACLVKNENV